MNEARIETRFSKFDSGSHRCLQFQGGLCTWVRAHTDALQISADREDYDDDDDQSQQSTTPTPGAAASTNRASSTSLKEDCYDVHLVVLRAGVGGILPVPCGHCGFRLSCTGVMSMPSATFVRFAVYAHRYDLCH